jgi:hypothetical protein
MYLFIHVYMYNIQIRVNISTQIHFFVVEIFNILSPSFFEIYNCYLSLPYYIVELSLFFMLTLKTVFSSWNSYSFSYFNATFSCFILLVPRTSPLACLVVEALPVQ